MNFSFEGMRSADQEAEKEPKLLFERVEDRCIDRMTVSILMDYMHADEIAVRNITGLAQEKFRQYCEAHKDDIERLKVAWGRKSMNLPGDEKSQDGFEETLVGDFPLESITSQIKNELRGKGCLRVSWHEER